MPPLDLARHTKPRRTSVPYAFFAVMPSLLMKVHLITDTPFDHLGRRDRSAHGVVLLRFLSGPVLYVLLLSSILPAVLDVVRRYVEGVAVPVQVR